MYESKINKKRVRSMRVKGNQGRGILKKRWYDDNRRNMEDKDITKSDTELAELRSQISTPVE